MRSAELVSHSGWLFFSCWSSCGVSEVSSFLSVPLPSCLPDVSSASEGKSACQVDYFHLIKPAPCPFCLSVFPSQWFTHSVSCPLSSFTHLFFLTASNSPPDFIPQALLDAHSYYVCTHAGVWTHVKFTNSSVSCIQNVCPWNGLLCRLHCQKLSCSETIYDRVVAGPLLHNYPYVLPCKLLCSLLIQAGSLLAHRHLLQKSFFCQ